MTTTTPAPTCPKFHWRHDGSALVDDKGVTFGYGEDHTTAGSIVAEHNHTLNLLAAAKDAEIAALTADRDVWQQSSRDWKQRAELAEIASEARGERIHTLAAEIARLRKALHAIAFEPQGAADASALSVLDAVVSIARAALNGGGE